MPGFLEQCESLFDTKDLYKILEVSNTATEQEIKKAYYKVSLKTHPDKSCEEDKEKAKEVFQLVGNAYSILSDKEKRAIYDETGQVPDDDVDQIRDWTAYWRLLFKRVTTDAIDTNMNKYKGSEEELEDLKRVYEEGSGDMDYILDQMLFATIEDEPRYRAILIKCIENNEVEEYDTLTKEKKDKAKRRQKKYAKEAEEAEELLREKGSGGGDGLGALILARQKSREQQADAFMANLEAKYCQPKQKGKKRKTVETNEENHEAKPKPKRDSSATNAKSEEKRKLPARKGKKK